MKFLLSAILLVSLGLAQTTAPQSSNPIPVDQENARKAKAVIDQAIEALGGQAYLGIQDASQQGRTYSFYHGRPNGYGVEYWLFYRYPDKERDELTKKRDVAYVINGDKGYEITYKGTRAMDTKDLTDALRRRQFALDWVLRHWINELGVALFYDGPVVAADKPAEQITILNSKNQGVTLDFDSATHLPLKKSFSWRDPTDKERNVEEEIYDNYRPGQGIMTPFSITRFYNGDMSNQRFLNSVTYNHGLADSMFNVQTTYDANQPAPRK
jgi:hypothetical protein